MPSVKKISFSKAVLDKKFGDKLMHSIKKSFVESTTTEIMKTISEMQGTTESLRSLKENKENDWLSMLVYSLIYSTKAMPQFRYVSNAILGSKAGEFIGDFENRMGATVEQNINRRYGMTEAAEITVTLKPTDNSPKTEELARAFAATVHGGNFTPGDAYEEVKEGEDATTMIINANPGFYENKMKDAERMMQEHFLNRLEDNMESSLKEEIETELSKFTE